MSESATIIVSAISAVGAVLGAAWIIAQAMLKTASNPVYDTKFAYGEKIMDELKVNIDQLKMEVREVRHGQANLRTVVQGMADKIENLSGIMSKRG